MGSGNPAYHARVARASGGVGCQVLSAGERSRPFPPPIKKLLGDLLLLRAERGILFFPDIPESTVPGTLTIQVIRRLPSEYGGVMPLAPTVELVHLAPDMPHDQLQERFGALTTHIATLLPERTAPRCEGTWLDSASHNSTQSVPQGQIVCPKSHIGIGVVDIVSPADCLRNPRLCYVMGQNVLPPFVVRAHSAEELQSHSQLLRR